MHVLIGSRQSALAQIQAQTVGKKLKSLNPQIHVEYLFKQSLGDQNANDPLWKMPEKGVFTKDFKEDLMTGRCDLVVHSWKDLPIEESADTQIAATLEREDLRDLALYHPEVKGTKNLRVLTSSPRRQYNLSQFFSKALPWALDSIEFLPVRGNIQTRIQKLLEGQGDVLIVAAAALDRLQAADGFPEATELIQRVRQQCPWQMLPIRQNPTAAAQGALAIEIKRSRTDLFELLQEVNCSRTFAQVQLERRILKGYGGGCHQAIGANVIEVRGRNLISLRGQTDSGEILDRWDWVDPPSDFSWSPENRLWSSNLEVRRTPIDWDTSRIEGRSHLFVSRVEAWPEKMDLSDRVVWAAGFKTWQKLAAKGVWVHGTAEGLGQLGPLTPKQDWLNLTHSQENGANDLATYTRHLKSVEDLTHYSHFFWRSGSMFLQLKDRFPNILQGKHFCGPGKTFEVLQAVIPKERLWVVPSHQSLLKWIEQKDGQ